MRITVHDLMMHQPLTIRQNASLGEALATLLREEAGEIYVVDQSSRLLGVLPDYELLKAKLTGVPSSEPVETLMSRHLATVSPSTQAAEIAPIFRYGKHRQLAVVEEGCLVGQISRRDILRLLVTTEQPAVDSESAAVDVPSDQPPSTLRRPRYMQTNRVRATHR